MKQLSGLDVSFLNLETSTTFGHVSSLSIYTRPEDPTFDPYVAFRDQIESRLGQLEPLRRKLVEVPFGLDRPYWINDADFDLDFHVRHIAVPGSGDETKVGDLVGRLIGRPMDRARPLWEAYVIEGLEDPNDFAVLMKLHHSTIDGAAGAELIAMILGPADSDEDETEWHGERYPTTQELLFRTAVEYARTPAKAIRLQLKALNEIGRITQLGGFDVITSQVRRGLPGPAGKALSRLIGGEEPTDPDSVPRLPRFGGPRTPFNAKITAHRRFAYRSVSLAHIKKVKTALDATVNDVVMAMCAGALRRYLLEHEALPKDDLIAMIPVSIRNGAEQGQWSNRVSAIFADLPTASDTPLERVSKVRSSMNAAKEQFDLVPADMLIEMSELAPPALSVRAARLASRTGLANRAQPPANLVISNVPGPREELHLGGARLKHYYPVSTVVDGQGLNITVQSYVDVLDFGLVACRELVPDLWTLADYCVEELAILAKAAKVKLS